MVEELFAIWDDSKKEYSPVVLIEDELGNYYLNFDDGPPEFHQQVINKSDILLGARGLELDDTGFIDEHGIVEIPVNEVL